MDIVIQYAAIGLASGVVFAAMVRIALGIGDVIEMLKAQEHAPDEESGAPEGSNPHARPPSQD
jgi:hypothetical protein